MLSIEVEVVGSEVGIEVVLREVELGLDDAALGTGLQHAEVSPLAQQEADGSQEDALSGSRLARNDRETTFEANVQVVNEGVVLYVECA